MNKKILIALIICLGVSSSAYANQIFSESEDFTGDAFFTPPALKRLEEQKKQEKVSVGNKTLPPVKRARLWLKNKQAEKDAKKYELAPTAPEDSIYAAGTGISEYASQDIEDNFEENIMPDGFEADEESVNETKKIKRFGHKKTKKEKITEHEDTENIILDCENVDYDTENYCVIAKGDVSVRFVKQDTIVKADTITYDRVNNTIKAEGNVRILKNGQTVTGDYIFVDMNEENALIENPITKTATLEIKSKKGYVYGDKIVQEDGSMSVDSSFPINFRSIKRGPHLSQMLVPKDETLTSDLEKGLIKLQVKDMQITQKGDLEIIKMKKLGIFKGSRRILKLPASKIYTNKNFEFFETGSWEIGSFRGLGTYTGPGYVIELPKSVFKVVPFVNYYHEFGIGALGRYSSATNKTQAAYSTAQERPIIRGKQELDDNLYLHYGVNDYMDEWFLGRRRPKYGMGLVYNKAYASNDFLLKGHAASFAHQMDIGYYHDMDYNKDFSEKLGGSHIGTMRTRYMAQASQNFYTYKNEAKQLALAFDISSQLSAAIYGTGDTQILGRIGPRMHTQYKRWMQDIGYYHTAYDDSSPLMVYDAYRYGRSNVYLREYLRLSKYLTISWHGSINLSNDAPNDRRYQENAFYISVGPDDVKFSIGYDFVRENAYLIVELMMDAKGTRLDYEKLEIKQDKKAIKDNNPKEENGEFQKAKQAPVLQRAVVEEVKTVEDVI